MLTVIELSKEVGGARVNRNVGVKDEAAGGSIGTLGWHSCSSSDSGEGDESFRQVEEHFECEIKRYSTRVGCFLVVLFRRSLYLSNSRNI